MEDINNLRESIDDIDKKLVELFELRMDAVLKISQYKKENNMPILDSGREEEVIVKNQYRIKNLKLIKETEGFFQSIMSISRKYQSKQMFHNSENCDNITNMNEAIMQDNSMLIPEIEITHLDHKTGKLNHNVGFQGVCGSFSEQALYEHFGDTINASAFNEFEDVFKALEDGKIDYGVLPIENSSTGSISDIYDLLRKYGLYIVDERCVKVEHNLLAVKETKIEDIKEVYSHAQAFQQSNEFFKQYPQWTLIPYRNTATSAEYISKEKLKSKAAVASKKAAKLYNLDILKKKINYNSNNYTRFIIICRKLEIDSKCNKISVVLRVPHKVGALYDVLSHFAENNLSMMKIESRPILNRPWEYFFYIDFEGNIKESSVKSLINHMKENCSYFKLLGNYKAYFQKEGIYSE